MTKIAAASTSVISKRNKDTQIDTAAIGPWPATPHAMKASFEPALLMYHFVPMHRDTTGHDNRCSESG
jgi:hypothetical protein